MKRFLAAALLIAALIVSAYAYSVAYITTATTTTISARQVFLSHLVINGGTMGTITLWDNSAAGGAVFATISSPLAGQHYVYEANLQRGLKVVTADNTNLTVLYQ